MSSCNIHTPKFLRDTMCAINGPSSSQPLSGALTEEQEISKRSGALWKCIGRTPNDSGGFIYTLRYRKKYDEETFGVLGRNCAADNHSEKIYPAAEPYSFTLVFLDPRILTEKYRLIKEFAKTSFLGGIYKFFQSGILSGSDKAKENLQKNLWKIQKIGSLASHEQMYANEISQHKILIQLGYSIQKRKVDSPTNPSERRGVYLKLPDETALIALWNQLRLTRPDLPEFKLINSAGIAGDAEFIKAFLEYLALLSSGEEFCHDHISHIIPTLVSILCYGMEAIVERDRLRKIVSTIFDKIVIAQKAVETQEVPHVKPIDLLLLQAAASAFADNASAMSNIEKTQKNYPSHMTSVQCLRSVLNNKKIVDSFKRRSEFANVDMSPERLIDVWNQIAS